MRGPTDESAEFWRERAVRLKALARRAGVGGDTEDGTSAESREKTFTQTEDYVNDRDDTWTPSTRSVSAVSGWRVPTCSTTTTTTAAAAAASNGSWSRALGASWLGACANANAKTSTERSLESALDDARSIEAVRAGYKTLLREITRRHDRTRRDLELEVEELRARVSELEAAAERSGGMRIKSPTREPLLPLTPESDGTYELSPLSATDVTPRGVETPDGDDASDEEPTADEEVSTPKAFRPPRPPSRDGSENDPWVEAHERASLMAGALPTQVRPGKGYVCPFSGKVLMKTP